MFRNVRIVLLGNCRSSVTKFFMGYSKPSELSKVQANVQKCENCIARLKDLDELILSYKVNRDMITDEQYAKEYQECESYQDKLVQLLHTAKGHVAELQPLSPVVESSPYRLGYPIGSWNYQYLMVGLKVIVGLFCSLRRLLTK